MRWRNAHAAVVVVALVALLGCGSKEAEKTAPVEVPVKVSVDESKQTALSQNAAGAAKAPAAKSEAELRANCDECRARWCSKYEGYDLVAGCFDKPDLSIVKDPYPEFTKDCKAVVECARKHNCAYDRARGVVQCYCGSRYVDECKNLGPADDAPCVAEWQAAARSKENMDVLLRFDQAEYASGWAYHLLKCDRERCGPDSPLGRCTP